MIGGLIGGVGTLLGVAIVNVRMRRPETFLPIATVAVLLGMILQAAFLSDPYGMIGYFLLFVCWQSMVAAAIARALSSATAESADPGVAGPDSATSCAENSADYAWLIRPARSPTPPTDQCVIVGMRADPEPHKIIVGFD